MVVKREVAGAVSPFVDSKTLEILKPVKIEQAFTAVSGVNVTSTSVVHRSGFRYTYSEIYGTNGQTVLLSKFDGYVE
jgi:hypothetical protein